MTEDSTTGPVPPYMSFATMLNQIERMEREGTPSRIDRSYLVGMAGGTRNQFKMGLRSLGLIDESDQVTDTLVRLAKHPEDRKALLAAILRERFPPLVSLDENATRGQLDDVLAGYGFGVDTRRKAASFYVAAATYAGIALSPHIRPAKGVNSAAPRRTTAPRRPRKRPAAPVAPQAPSQGNAHVVKLKSSGQVTLSVSVNVMELSVDDREFVFHLIDKLRAYEGGSASSISATAESSSNGAGSMT